jgi:uncharacterized integral membrane protein
VVKQPNTYSNRSLAHYAGIGLLGAIFGIIFLTYTALAYEGNDLAQVGILIGILGSVVTGILGFMGGMVLGRHISESDKDKEVARAEGRA